MCGKVAIVALCGVEERGRCNGGVGNAPEGINVGLLAAGQVGLGPGGTEGLDNFGRLVTQPSRWNRQPVAFSVVGGW